MDQAIFPTPHRGRSKAVVTVRSVLARALAAAISALVWAAFASAFFDTSPIALGVLVWVPCWLMLELVAGETR